MSTLTEQIAAVKRVIDDCVANGYDDFQDDPHTFGHLTAMRSVLARLEGMAAPEEIHDLDAWIDEEARLAGQMMRDSPSPQQPTQEARELFLRLLRHSRAIDYLTDEQITERSEELAEALDRFAAQRMTAAEQELEQVTAANARWAAKCRNMFVEIERLTAATDKARREAIIGAALIVEDERDRRGSLIGAVHRLRALTQNPGEAAEVGQ